MDYGSPYNYGSGGGADVGPGSALTAFYSSYAAQQAEQRAQQAAQQQQELNAIRIQEAQMSLAQRQALPGAIEALTGTTAPDVTLAEGVPGTPPMPATQSTGADVTRGTAPSMTDASGAGWDVNAPPGNGPYAGAGTPNTEPTTASAPPPGIAAPGPDMTSSVVESALSQPPSLGPGAMLPSEMTAQDLGSPLAQAPDQNVAASGIAPVGAVGNPSPAETPAGMAQGGGQAGSAGLATAPASAGATVAPTGNVPLTGNEPSATMPASEGAPGIAPTTERMLTMKDVVAQIGPQNAAVLLATPEGKLALQSAGLVSDSEVSRRKKAAQANVESRTLRTASEGSLRSGDMISSNLQLAAALEREADAAQTPQEKVQLLARADAFRDKASTLQTNAVELKKEQADSTKMFGLLDAYHANPTPENYTAMMEGGATAQSKEWTGKYLNALNAAVTSKLPIVQDPDVDAFLRAVSANIIGQSTTGQPPNPDKAMKDAATALQQNPAVYASTLPKLLPLIGKLPGLAMAFGVPDVVKGGVAEVNYHLAWKGAMADPNLANPDGTIKDGTKFWDNVTSRFQAMQTAPIEAKAAAAVDLANTKGSIQADNAAARQKLIDDAAAGKAAQTQVNQDLNNANKAIAETDKAIAKLNTGFGPPAAIAQLQGQRNAQLQRRNEIAADAQNRGLQVSTGNMAPTPEQVQTHRSAVTAELRAAAGLGPTAPITPAQKLDIFRKTNARMVNDGMLDPATADNMNKAAAHQLGLATPAR